MTQKGETSDGPMAQSTERSSTTLVESWQILQRTYADRVPPQPAGSEQDPPWDELVSPHCDGECSFIVLEAQNDLHPCRASKEEGSYSTSLADCAVEEHEVESPRPRTCLITACHNGNAGGEDKQKRKRYALGTPNWKV
jgi:hypothetical protein